MRGETLILYNLLHKIEPILKKNGLLFLMVVYLMVYGHATRTRLRAVTTHSGVQARFTVIGEDLNN